MPLFENRYQKSSFNYSLMLSFIYLILLFAVLKDNSFLNPKIMDLIVFPPFVVAFITTINYKIMLSIGFKNSKFKNRLIFLPINILCSTLIYLILPFYIEIKTIISLFLIFIIPWIYYFSKIYKFHKRTLGTN